MVWENEKCLLLIELYEKQNVLWDPKHEHYFNKNFKQDAWKTISEIMKEEITELKKKITALLGSYRREKSREKKSLITGSGTDSIYKSKWFAYESFYFLSDKDDPRDTRDTILMEENTQNVEVIIDDGSGPLPPARRAAKRKADPMLDEAMELLRNVAQKKETPQSDAFSSYGNYIANELKKFDRATIAHVKYAINNILYQADMGYYSSHYGATEEYGYCSSRSRPSTATSQYSYSSVASPPPPPPPPPPPAQEYSDGEA